MYLFLHRYCTCPLPPLFIDSKLDVSIIYSKNITLSRAPCQSMNIKLSAYGYYSTVRDLHFTFLFSFQKKNGQSKGGQELVWDSQMLLTGRKFDFGQFLENKRPVDPSWHIASMQICGLLYFCNTDTLEGKIRLKKHPDYTSSALLATLSMEPLTTQKKTTYFLWKSNVKRYGPVIQVRSHFKPL